MKRLLLSLVLLAACARAPVMDELLIEPSADDDSVAVTVDTTFSLEVRNDRIRERVDAARTAALAGHDAWGLRFARLNPREEHVTFHKKAGALDRVTRSVRISADDLQQLFSDTSITVDAVDGDGWRELRFYPGTSGRATREQQRRFDSALGDWSAAVARYFTAVDRVYSYLDEHPQRERYVFEALVSKEETPVLDVEQALLEGVTQAMEEIAAKMDEQENSAVSFAEEADLIFNPFPARVIVRTPGDVLSSEGFTAKGRELRIEPVDLFGAIAELEGTWVAPDPLAILLREETPTAEELAELPRKSTPVVSATEVAAAIRERLTRPRTFAVRWRG